MQIAVTADVHLTNRARHPERYEALERILDAMCQREVNHLIIAGDLFDASRQDYAEFEALCQQPAYKQLDLYIIPGNHDPALKSSHFVAGNIHIIDEPKLVAFGDGRKPFLFIPYRKDKSMGEAISGQAAQLPPDDWVLIGHGNWTSGAQAGNPYEPGFYMPLTRTDVQTYRPAHVFLGHIHVPITRPPVHYPGSPCGLDITETGQRRFLIYDTNADEVVPVSLDAPLLFFDETIVILPVEDEASYLREQLEQRIAAWKLRPSQAENVRVRVKLSGFSANRQRLSVLVEEVLQPYAYYKGVKPDLSGVQVTDDVELATIASQVKARVQELVWPSDPAEPTADLILLEALNAIYRR